MIWVSLCVNLSKIELKELFHVRIWLTRRRLLVGVLLVRFVDGALAGDVQSGIDDFRDRLNLGAQLLFDAMKIETIFVRDEIDGNTWWRGEEPLSISFSIGRF